jgi:hypothetical protein
MLQESWKTLRLPSTLNCYQPFSGRSRECSAEKNQVTSQPSTDKEYEDE